MSAILAVLGGAAAATVFAFDLATRSTWLGNVRSRRALRKTRLLGPDTPDGEVARAIGTVRAVGEPLVAQASGLSCVAWRTWGAARVSLGRGGAVGGRQPQRFDNSLVTEFELETPAGLVSVRSEHARLLGARVPVPPLNPPRSEHVLLANALPTDRSLEVYEVAVAAGDTVEVAGLVMRDVPDAPPEGELGFRDEVPARAVLAGDANHPLVILVQRRADASQESG